MECKAKYNLINKLMKEQNVQIDKMYLKNAIERYNKCDFLELLNILNMPYYESNEIKNIPVFVYLKGKWYFYNGHSLYDGYKKYGKANYGVTFERIINIGYLKSSRLVLDNAHCKTDALSNLLTFVYSISLSSLRGIILSFSGFLVYRISDFFWKIEAYHDVMLNICEIVILIALCLIIQFYQIRNHDCLDIFVLPYIFIGGYLFNLSYVAFIIAFFGFVFSYLDMMQSLKNRFRSYVIISLILIIYYGLIMAYLLSLYSKDFISASSFVYYLFIIFILSVVLFIKNRGIVYDE